MNIQCIECFLLIGSFLLLQKVKRKEEKKDVGMMELDDTDGFIFQEQWWGGKHQWKQIWYSKITQESVLYIFILCIFLFFFVIASIDFDNLEQGKLTRLLVCFDLKRKKKK